MNAGRQRDQFLSRPGQRVKDGNTGGIIVRERIPCIRSHVVHLFIQCHQLKSRLFMDTMDGGARQNIVKLVRRQGLP